MDFNSYGVAKDQNKYKIQPQEQAAVKALINGVSKDVLAMMQRHLHKRKEKDAGVCHGMYVCRSKHTREHASAHMYTKVCTCINVRRDM
jgi:hypothetical protein